MKPTKEKKTVALVQWWSFIYFFGLHSVDAICCWMFWYFYQFSRFLNYGKWTIQLLFVFKVLTSILSKKIKITNSHFLRFVSDSSLHKKTIKVLRIIDTVYKQFLATNCICQLYNLIHSDFHHISIKNEFQEVNVVKAKRFLAFFFFFRRKTQKWSSFFASCSLHACFFSSSTQCMHFLNPILFYFRSQTETTHSPSIFSVFCSFLSEFSRLQ